MTKTAAPTARQFGRCPEKGCTTRIVLDPTTDARVQLGQHGWVTVDAPARTDLGHGAIVGAHGMVLCATRHARGHAPLKFSGIRATLNHMECGPQCWNATAADCKCSCGGARHGETAG